MLGESPVKTGLGFEMFCACYGLLAIGMTYFTSTAAGLVGWVAVPLVRVVVRFIAAGVKAEHNGGSDARP